MAITTDRSKRFQEALGVAPEAKSGTDRSDSPDDLVVD